jgi:hypothetical protein
VGGSASLTDVPQTRGPQQAYIDTDVRLEPGGSRQKHLRVDSMGLSWGDEDVSFDEVTKLAYWVEGIIVKGNYWGLASTINLYTSGNRPTRVYFGGQKVGPTWEKAFRPLFEQTVAALHRHIEWRLISEIIADLDRGEEVEVAGFVFSRQGLSRRGLLGRGRQASWAAVFEVRPFSDPPPGGLKIFADEEQPRKRKIGDTFIDYPNCVLLPTLVRACVERYSAG